MNHIIPTVFSRNKKEFNLRFKKLIKISKDVQIDIMDGKFVGSKSIKFNEIPNLHGYENNFEIHLMTKNPEDYIDVAVKKGFGKIIAHVETIKNFYEMIKHVKNHKIEIYFAINPETNVKKIIPWLKDVDGVLLMGVHPGKEHQKLISSIYNKIKTVRKVNKKIKIQVDGGVNLNNIKKLKKIGVNSFNSGSFIAESENPGKALRELERA